MTKIFLKIVWHYDIDKLNKLQKMIKNDLSTVKSLLTSGMVLTPFYKREKNVLEVRLKFIKDIIKDKKKDPNFIPDFVK